MIRNGDAALLIDIGDGRVPDHLSEIGEKRSEWVLFTHHHREQTQVSMKKLAISAANGICCTTATRNSAPPFGTC